MTHRHKANWLPANTLSRLSFYRWMTPTEMRKFHITIGGNIVGRSTDVLCRGMKWRVIRSDSTPDKDFVAHVAMISWLLQRPHRQQFGQSIRIVQVPKAGRMVYHPLFMGGTQKGREFDSMAEAIGWTSYLLELAKNEAPDIQHAT